MTPSSSSRPAAGGSAAVGAAVTAGAGSGGTAIGDIAALSAEPIDMVGMLSGAHHPGAGAVVLFSGEVRDNNLGQTVNYLEYEAYAPMAEKMIGEILAAAKTRWSLKIALAQHRTGIVAVGDTAVVVITASAHRTEAYAANRYIIDRIKHEAPIWKCEHYADGRHEWGNNCNCHAVTGDVSKHIYEIEG